MSKLSDAWHSPYGAQTVNIAYDYIAELEAESQRLQGENESLLVERRRLEAERQRLRDALEAILNITCGYDGDCGAARIAEQALEKEI